jgi:hypothetical protein
MMDDNEWIWRQIRDRLFNDLSNLSNTDTPTEPTDVASGPFTIEKCLVVTPPGGTCVIPAGDYPEILTISQPLRLESQGGTVRIGERP